MSRRDINHPGFGLGEQGLLLTTLKPFQLHCPIARCFTFIAEGEIDGPIIKFISGVVDAFKFVAALSYSPSRNPYSFLPPHI